MLEQLKNDAMRIKQWCENHKRISSTIVIALILIIGSIFVLEEMLDYGDDEFNYQSKQGYSTEQFMYKSNFKVYDEGGDDMATLNPQLAIISLIIVIGVALIVGVGVFIFIHSIKKNIKPLPVLYNPIKDCDKEVNS